MSADPTTEIVYPESDGKPMADNTLQWEWIVKIAGELREQFAGQEVFVAGDLFWYPVEGRPDVVQAPDVLVAFGRPPGRRGSYMQWREAGVAPQVVFEVRSPSNTEAEMRRKVAWYSRYSVEEYYELDPDRDRLRGYGQEDGVLVDVREMDGFVSPRLGARFARTANGWTLFAPDGREYQQREERVAEITEELRKTALAFEDEHRRAIDAERAAEAERLRAETALTAQAQLAAKLRELGIDPNDILRPTG